MSRRVVVLQKIENGKKIEIYPNVLSENIPRDAITSDKLSPELQDKIENGVTPEQLESDYTMSFQLYELPDGRKDVYMPRIIPKGMKNGLLGKSHHAMKMASMPLMRNAPPKANMLAPSAPMNEGILKPTPIVMKIGMAPSASLNSNELKAAKSIESVPRIGKSENLKKEEMTEAPMIQKNIMMLQPSAQMKKKMMLEPSKRIK